MRADLLAADIDGLVEALDVVNAFDHALVAGFMRPQAATADALAGLAVAVAGTPLAARVAEAADKAASGVAGEDHLTAVAAARTALLGSVHDALLATVDAATGRAREAWTAQEAAEPYAGNLRAAARSWLAELALGGWQGMNHDTVAGSAQVVGAMLPDARLRRLAALLDGFAAELAASCPGASLDRFPERRWADLWSRAMLLSQPGFAGPGATTTATGRLLPLGIDLTEHATAAQAQVHAVFEPADGGPSRIVRAGVSTPKPDTVVGVGVWQLLRPSMSLLAAFSDGRSMDIADMPLTPEGDLIWSDAQAGLGDAADPFATARVALAAATASPTAPLDRHPTRIAEPVFLEGYAVKKSGDAPALGLPGLDLPVAAERLPEAGPLTLGHVEASTACIGLLRWDAGSFVIQPLAVQTPVKKKPTAIHAGAWAGGAADANGAKAEKAAAEAVKVLRERAGRLLRK
ncbi:MAG TPA: hypothetical protein VFN97_06835 [Actinospica sp.]|nr:hypothetical protein [Actinospica sp.]